MPQIIEGTWDEIKRREAELAGHRVRVIIDPDQDDLAAGTPPPPTSIHNADDLVAQLIDGISSPKSPVTPADWEDMRRRLQDLARTKA